ncbi:MAG: hypothetical protein GY722_14180 [bacterium]|nr:hypothetical protein [bacterium]
MKVKHRREPGPEKLPIKRGEDLLGFVVVTDCDDLWTRGPFTPGPDFDKYRELFESERKSARKAAVLGGEDYIQRVDASLRAIYRIDRLELRVGEDPVPVRRFCIDEESRASFKARNQFLQMTPEQFFLHFVSWYVRTSDHQFSGGIPIINAWIELCSAETVSQDDLDGLLSEFEATCSGSHIYDLWGHVVDWGRGHGLSAPSLSPWASS